LARLPPAPGLEAGWGPPPGGGVLMSGGKFNCRGGNARRGKAVGLKEDATPENTRRRKVRVGGERLSKRISTLGRGVKGSRNQTPRGFAVNGKEVRQLRLRLRSGGERFFGKRAGAFSGRRKRVTAISRRIKTREGFRTSIKSLGQNVSNKKVLEVRAWEPRGALRKGRRDRELDENSYDDPERTEERI